MEKQNTQESVDKKEQQEQENQKKFEDNCKSEASHEAFKDLTSGQKYDETKSGEENIKQAFDTKVNGMIEKNLKNLPPEEKDKLENLKKEAQAGKSSQELLDLYQEINEEISTRIAESNKAKVDTNQQKEQTEKQNTEKKSNEFVEALKKAIEKESQAQKEQTEKKQAEKLAMENAQKEQVANAEQVLDGFPDSVA